MYSYTLGWGILNTNDELKISVTYKFTYCCTHPMGGDARHINVSNNKCVYLVASFFFGVALNVLPFLLNILQCSQTRGAGIYSGWIKEYTVYIELHVHITGYQNIG